MSDVISKPLIETAAAATDGIAAKAASTKIAAQAILHSGRTSGSLEEPARLRIGERPQTIP
jgi:hypothetical protein